MVQMRHHNHISLLKYIQGNILTKDDEIEQELVKFLQTLVSEPKEELSLTRQKITSNIP
jgi:hypothetical protein